MAVDDRYGSVRTVAAMDGPEPASVRGLLRAGFPYRDVLVARTCGPRADAAATHVACAPANRMGGVVVVPRQASVDLTGVRSIVIRVRDLQDTTSVVAAVRALLGDALLAVTASRRGPFASALLGSTARNVTRHADRPVLVRPRQPDPALRAHRS